MELSSPNIKKSLIFFKIKFFLHFGKRKSRKNSLYFRKFLIFQEISYISSNNFSSPKNEKKKKNQNVSNTSRNGTF